MKLCFEAHFDTDGDFRFDERQVQERFKIEKSLYEGAETKYDYKQDGEYIDICLSAEGDANACRWYFRDLIEELICSIRTSKYWLVKDLYELLDYFHEDLWKEVNQQKENGLLGNYMGTLLTLKIEE